MKVHIYQLPSYPLRGYTSIYLPNQGVLAFYERNGEIVISCYKNTPKNIAEAEEIISGKAKIEGGAKYLRQVELPDLIIKEFVHKWEAKEKARKDFIESANGLVGLVGE